MAVALEFINLLVRVDAIRSKYLGGWHQFLKDHEQAIGSTGWYDDNLYREGAMSPTDIGHLVDFWREKGLTTHRDENGQPAEWIDVCVSEFFGPTLPCSWYADDSQLAAAYLKGTAPGKVMTRKDFPEFDFANWYLNN